MDQRPIYKSKNNKTEKCMTILQEKQKNVSVTLEQGRYSLKKYHKKIQVKIDKFGYIKITFPKTKDTTKSENKWQAGRKHYNMQHIKKFNRYLRKKIKHINSQKSIEKNKTKDT